MAEPRVVIEHPNRKKASSKVTKAIVVFLLLVSAALVAIVTLGGWDTLEGAKILTLAYIVLYVVMAVLVAGWKRGLLPVASAMAIVLLIFAAVSAPAWFDRDKSGLSDPPLDESLIGLVCVLIAIAQLLLIAVAMCAFQQQWNVEVERRVDDGRSDGPDREPAAPRGGGAPQPA